MKREERKRSGRRYLRKIDLQAFNVIDLANLMLVLYTTVLEESVSSNVSHF